jgi:D-alanine-D-alanine ligase
VLKDDIIFNLAIGKRNDFLQGDIAAFCQMSGNEYVGSPPYTHYLCLDKFATKQILKAYGIKTPQGILYDGKTFRGKLSIPAIIKPVAEGSGIGIDDKSLCYDVDELKERVVDKFKKLNEPILIERFLDGPEITVGVIGSENNLMVLPELEIDFSNLPEGIERYYSQRVKENFGSQTIYRCPSDFNEKVRDRIRKVAIKSFEAVKARDYVRMDMRIVNEIPYVIEINSMPGLDPLTSDLPKMVKPLNKDYEWLIKAIIKRVIEKEGG